MRSDTLTVALIREVFVEAGALARLVGCLRAARAGGAALALLPELPLNAWSPATRTPRDEDAEAPGGPRHQALAAAARQAGVAVAGGAIVRDPSTGRRYNTALVHDARGELVATYRKLHLPEEEGFWETSHYEPGDEPPRVIERFAMPLGVQICSDLNRPQGSHLLAAQGAEAILAPRATEAATWERWKLVLRANAITAAAYVLTVSRPAAEGGVPLGGPSAVIDPHGTVVVETLDAIAFAPLDREVVREARAAYPGYLRVAADVYARGWRDIASATRPAGARAGRCP